MGNFVSSLFFCFNDKNLNKKNKNKKKVSKGRKESILNRKEKYILIDKFEDNLNYEKNKESSSMKNFELGQI